MGILDNLADATVYDSSKYFEPGDYIVRFKEAKEFDGDGKSYMKFEGTVVATNNTAGVQRMQGETDEALERRLKKLPLVGEDAAHLFPTTGTEYAAKYAQADLLGFLTGVTGAAQDDYNNAQWKAVATNVFQGALLGQYLWLHTWPKEKKKKKGEFITKHEWGQMTPERWAQFGLQDPAVAA